MDTHISAFTIKSSIISSIPNNIQSINDSGFYGDFTLRSPGSITKLPNIIKRLKVQGEIQTRS
jgi:hypothetical protein